MTERQETGEERARREVEAFTRAIGRVQGALGDSDHIDADPFTKEWMTHGGVADRISTLGLVAEVSEGGYRLTSAEGLSVKDLVGSTLRAERLDNRAYEGFYESQVPTIQSLAGRVAAAQAALPQVA